MAFEKAITRYMSTQLHEAPFEWVSTFTLPWLDGCWFLVVAGASIQLCISMISAISVSLPIESLAISSFRVAGAVFAWHASRRRDYSIEFKHGIAFVCLSLLIMFGTSHHDAMNTVTRHRVMGMQAIFWRIAVPGIAARMSYCMIATPILTTIEIIATWRSMRMFDESGFQRVSCVLMIISVLSMFWCCAVVRTWYTLYRNQQQILLEQEASQSLLSMVCDATFWLAADGETLLHNNPQMESLLGTTGIKGTKFSRYLPGNEHARFQSLLGSESQHVRLLPITLQKVCAGQVGVDLFVVDRRLNMTDESVWQQPASCRCNEPGGASGVLIGVRVTAESEVCVEAPALEFEVTAAATTARTASCSSNSDGSMWSLARIPDVESIRIEFDSLSQSMPVTTISLDLASSEGNVTMDQCVLQPSWESFRMWIQEQVNCAMTGESPMHSQLSAILVRLPRCVQGNRSILISASESYIDHMELENLADDEYPMCTLVLKGLHHMVKGHRQRGPLPAISEFRQRSNLRGKHGSGHGP